MWLTACADVKAGGGLAVSLGVNEKVSLQVDFQTPNCFAARWVSDQSQFVKHSSTEIVSHDREPII